MAISGVDIALWDIAGKTFDRPLFRLLGGTFRDRIPVYGYGMMLQGVPDLARRFGDEAARIEDMGLDAMKMKIGRGPREDVQLVRAVREAIGSDTKLMVDANHAYTAREATPLGREIRFREDRLTESLGVLDRVETSGGWVGLPRGPGLGIEIDFDFVDHYRVAA